MCPRESSVDFVYIFLHFLFFFGKSVPLAFLLLLNFSWNFHRKPWHLSNGFRFFFFLFDFPHDKPRTILWLMRNEIRDSTEEFVFFLSIFTVVAAFHRLLICLDSSNWFIKPLTVFFFILREILEIR